MAKIRDVSLNDKYTLDSGRVFMTGIQALVRLPLVQRRRDLAVGHDTAGYVTGYRGSPLGALDQQLVRADTFLDEHHVKFNPGVNEDLAATACWGTQQAHLNGEGVYDGVFAMWYGKGPGVDRSGDALRHSNLAGTAPLGGVLALLGDDHTCESSTTCHQSELAMVDAMIPVLNPAGVQEILDYGLLGWALSRYSGCWVGLKCVHDTVEAAASVVVDTARVEIRLPTDHPTPQDGVHLRWPDTPQAQEARLHNIKHDAVRAFARANQLDREIFGCADAKIGIVTTGKSYLDVRQALEDLGIDAGVAEKLGLRLYKVAMSYPLEPVGLRKFCADLKEVIVVEEKRALIETQLKELMYGEVSTPRIVGKLDENHRRLFPSAGRLDTNHIAAVIGQRVLSYQEDAGVRARFSVVEGRVGTVSPTAPLVRTPYFCAGCPHNSSTKVPEGSRALAGIGCHYLAQFMDRDTARYTQMGAEGASWIGEAPFSRRQHMFQNIGDGTYFHSGLLAIRAAVASRVNITFKVLYNDAVAMTGGQPMDGPLTVPRITQQAYAEGATRVVVVTDEPDNYPGDAGFAPGVTVHHRDELDHVQRTLRDIKGTTVLVYDQTCAAEKRRRRKRGLYPDPPKRAVINEAVCEGCGDCGVKSNCVAVAPLETEFGRKRTIDQSMCNKDFSCVNGFCPSFVTVHGGRLRRNPLTAECSDTDVWSSVLPEPTLLKLDAPYSIIVTGVGGTGVITIGALLGMAAHLESKGCSILDQTGLAQKNGAVVSHVRIAPTPDDLSATRIPNGGADVLLGCDMVVAGGPDALCTLNRGRTRAVVNTHETMTGEFTHNADLEFPARSLQAAIDDCLGDDHGRYLDATRLATSLMGDAIATNLFMLGVAYQRGYLPVSVAAIERSIELNGVAVAMNKEAFLWGRRAAVDLKAVTDWATPGVVVNAPKKALTLTEQIERRVAFLTEYQDSALAERYRSFVENVKAGELERTKGLTGLAAATAHGYFKLLAYKDEYEVARLYTNGAFAHKIDELFEGDYRLKFHLAPPLLGIKRDATEAPVKYEFGPWVLTLFKWLARCRGLRGTVFDIFGYTRERRAERKLIVWYETLIAEILDELTPDNHGIAVQLACLPEGIRGFGGIKKRHVERALARERELLAAFRHPDAPSAAA